MATRKHELLLSFPETYNTKVFKVRDESLYSDNLGSSCGLLQIVPPGFNVPVGITVDVNFDLNLSACSLGVQTEDCGTSNVAMDDGIYVIRYSLSPHESVYVEYNHLRMSEAMSLYYSLLGDLELNACMPPKEVHNRLMELRTIKMYLDAAKAKVEYCGDSEKGIKLFTYAFKKLENFECKTEC